MKKRTKTKLIFSNNNKDLKNLNYPFGVCIDRKAMTFKFNITFMLTYVVSNGVYTSLIEY